MRFDGLSAALFGLIVTACASDDGDAAPLPRESPTHGGAVEGTPEPPRTTTIGGPTSDGTSVPVRFQSCEDSFECARVQVPIDYANPTRGTLELFVKRRRARGRRIGSLLVNPGGPGASAVDYLPGFVQRADAKLLDAFDIVAFDPRGVGRSTPLDCHSALIPFFSADPSPDDEREWRGITEAAGRFAQECGQKHAALLPHLATPNVARDMDRVRAALGDEKLSYLGFSYGTAIGAWYAELFPARVRALVLDGAVDLTLSAVDLAREQGSGFDATLKSYFAWCAGPGSRCAWTRGRPAAEEFARLSAAIDQRPLAPRRADRPAGPGELALGVAVTLYGGESGWRALSIALGAAVNGDGDSLVGLADSYLQRRPDRSYANIQEANQAVNCLDYPAPPVAALRAEAARFSAAAPIFGVPALTGLLICAQWPASTPRAAPPVGRDAPPIVVVGTTGDPATPYAWATHMAEQLSSAVLLTYEGEGHTAYGRGVTCIDGAIDDYLLSGKVPVDGTRCQPRAPSELDETVVPALRPRIAR